MTAIEPICTLIGINPRNHSKEEIYLLEIFLFFSLCDELSQVFHDPQSSKNIISNNEFNKDDIMINGNLINLILQDLINSSDYSILGIALYTQLPEDIIQDILIGINTNPSLEASRKIVDLHRAVRADLYKYIIKKINDNYFENNAAETG